MTTLIRRAIEAAHVRERRGRFGRNRLQRTEVRSAWRILRDQFKSLMVALLALAAPLFFAFAQRRERIGSDAASVAL